jgi:hypothetical protein
MRITILVIAGLVSACSVNRALDEPGKKNYGVLQPGTNRDLVRAELGKSIGSTTGDTCDVFAFEEGSSSWKYARAVGYGLLDIGSFGATELVTNPVEASVGKDKIQVRVCYDDKQNVAYSERLEIGKGARLMTGQYPASVEP